MDGFLFLNVCVSTLVLSSDKAAAVGVQLTVRGELVPWYLTGVNVKLGEGGEVKLIQHKLLTQLVTLHSGQKYFFGEEYMGDSGE